MLLPPLCPFVAPARNLPDLSPLMPASPLASHGWRDRRGNPIRSNTCKCPTTQNASTPLGSAPTKKGAGASLPQSLNSTYSTQNRAHPSPSVPLHLQSIHPLAHGFRHTGGCPYWPTPEARLPLPSSRPRNSSATSLARTSHVQWRTAFCRASRSQGKSAESDSCTIARNSSVDR